MIKRASIIMRPGRHYRRDQFTAGLERLGYEVLDRHCPNPRAGDLLLAWNRNRNLTEIAAIYERAGATVIVTENGYIPGPDGEKHFALAANHHNGAGRWTVGDRPRFPVELKPWRETGEHILVLPQRGIGAPGVAMPIGWYQRMAEKLAKMTKRPIRVRRHPGLMVRYRPLEEDLAGAWACVTWGSGAGIKALVAGVPVFYAMIGWIGGPAALAFYTMSDLEKPLMPDRDSFVRGVTWAQWSGEEIATGEPIARLLACA